MAGKISRTHENVVTLAHIAFIFMNDIAAFFVHCTDDPRLERGLQRVRLDAVRNRPQA